MDLDFEIQKTNVGTRINNLEITCVPIFRQNEHFDFFGPNLPKNEFRVGNSENQSWSKNHHRQDAMRADF